MVPKVSHLTPFPLLGNYTGVATSFSTYKAGTGAKVAVDTTEVKNIWKANGAKPGMVLYEVYTTVYITPRDGLAEQLRKK